MYKCSLFSILSPAFVICVLFDDSHSQRCEVVSHCGWFAFLWWLGMGSIFSVPVGHLPFLFGKMSIQFFCPFFNQVFFFLLSCMSYLYMLDFNSLSVISFANISSHSVSCLFMLSMVSFPVQYPKNPKTSNSRRYTPVFITMLFTSAKIWKQPKHPSTDEWIKKMW